MTKYDIENTVAYKASRPGEDLAQEIIKQHFNVDIIENDKTPGRENFHEYDFKTSNNKKYEVKEDKMSAFTGNFFIQTYQDYGTGKIPSSIKVTKSDFYMILSGNKFYVIPTELLVSMIDALEKHDLEEPNVKKKKEKSTYDPIRKHTRYGYIIPIRNILGHTTIIEF
jgi:hypothetical protein